MKRFYLFLQAVLLIALISCEPIEPGGETAKDYWLQTFTVTAAESGDLLFSTVTDETLFVDYKTEISDSDFVKPLANASEAKDLACVQFQAGSSKFFVPFSTEDLKSGNGNSTVSGISLTAEGSFNAGDNFTYKLKAASESNADIYKSIEVRRKPTSFLIGYVMRDAGKEAVHWYFATETTSIPPSFVTGVEPRAAVLDYRGTKIEGFFVNWDQNQSVPR